MGRYVGAKCRLCRREGAKLFLKGSRCTTGKCAFERKNYQPGQHPHSRTKTSDYGMQLREKQKAKRIYGLFEQQFKNYFKKAAKTKGVTGELLLQFLERRLDNVVYRACFASDRTHARQIVSHGLIKVNGRRVTIPSFLVKEGDKIQPNISGEKLEKMKKNIEQQKERGCPNWLQADFDNLAITIVKLPQREDVGFPIKEHMIVELYSK